MASPAPQPSGRKATPAQRAKLVRFRLRRGQAKQPAAPLTSAQKQRLKGEVKHSRMGRESAARNAQMAALRRKAGPAFQGFGAAPSSPQPSGIYNYPAPTKPAPQAAPERPLEEAPQATTKQVRMVGKRSQPARKPAPPRQPVKVQIVPGAKQREPGTPPESAIFLLGMGLVAVALLHSTIIPAFDLALHGKQATHKYTLPAAQALALVAFVFLLVWISDISDGAARAVFWFLLALWAVYLLLSPDRPLQWIAGLVGAGSSEPASTAANTAQTAQPSTAKVGA